MTNEKQLLKNEIQNGLNLEKEIAEKKKSLIKTNEDIVKVTHATELEKNQNKIFIEQFKQMHHNSEGMPQVILDLDTFIFYYCVYR